MSEDPEIEEIKQRRLEEMMRRSRMMATATTAATTPGQQNQPQIEQGVTDLDETNFHQTISSETPTLVDFWAEWCGPCKMMHPVFESLDKRYLRIRFARVNVDQNQGISMKYRVQSIPTFIMFKAGMAVDQMMGAVGAPGIHMICKKHSPSRQEEEES